MLKKLIVKIIEWILSPVINRLNQIIRRLDRIDLNIDSVQQSLGRIENRQLEANTNRPINDFEYKVYSQWGEDGIIQYLIRNVTIQVPIFVEFGIEDYKEANTRFLLTNNNWSGLVIDCNSESITRFKTDRIYWQYNIKAINEYIRRDNINQILIGNGVEGEIGLLSIDIDGNDYWIWDAINVIQPIIVVIEYNYRFGQDLAVTIPYSDYFDHSTAHSSQIYYGASLRALHILAEHKGYDFIGCCNDGVNAFFIRKDRRPPNIKVVTIEEGYRAGNHSEIRDKGGNIIKTTPIEEMNYLLTQNLPLIYIE